MILSDRGGVAYTRASDGDQRADRSARERVSAALGIPEGWATVHQVHGADVVEVGAPGEQGEADALFTDEPGLPLAVLTADCLGVVVHGDGGVGVAHAGWRGLAAGVLERLLDAMRVAGMEPSRAAVGPAIGPCCFEVGRDVARLFPDQVLATTWGTPSVDLVAAAEERLGLALERLGGCTRCGPDAFSHRRDRTPHRMAAIGWRP